MSRCFPYSPPGYHRNGATCEALIESIKLQKKTDKTKAERKLEKKAKKERKLEKKANKEKRNNDGSSKVLQKVAETQVKPTKPITEVFEKSDLTEEHGQPISPHQPSYSSDSTQNSNKRKIDDATFVPDSSTGHGKLLKILVKKRKECVDLFTGKNGDLAKCDVEQNPSFGRQDVSGIQEVPSSSGSRHGFHLGTHDHGVDEPVVMCNGGHSTGLEKLSEGPKKVGPTRSEKKRLKKHAKYERLIKSWLPPVVEAQLPGGDDEEWLSRGCSTANVAISRGEVETCRDLVMPWQPCARFLADVGIHVMPYTVPF